MEEIRIELNSSTVFARECDGTDGMRTLADGGDLRVTTCDNITNDGGAGVCLSFTVDVDGTVMRAKTVTTVKLLLATLHVLRGRYDSDGKEQPMLTEEQMATDVLSQMPDDIRAGFLHDALKLALYKLPPGDRRVLITTPEGPALAKQLHLSSTLNPHSMAFEIRVSKKS
jgi:hypothetical protein